MKALIINCTLKKSPSISNTEALIDKAVRILESQHVEAEVVRLVDYNIKPGTATDEGDGDQWPLILGKIKQCHILIIGTPVWVGRLASTAQRVIERLDAIFHEEGFTNEENGQYFTYNKVAGCLVTGNEDGAHSCVAHVLWAMQEFGFTIPPNVNAYWVNKAGPGKSYIEAGGERCLYTNKTLHNTMHNLIFFADLLQRNPITTNLLKLAELAKQESDPD